jgi:4-diphosphocytidyl-2-C-methyl-D-erythritol kinase
MKVMAPAKINLTLEVLGKRADGYHELRSVIQTVSFCDELEFTESQKTEFGSDLTGWAGEKSLAAKTVELLRKETGTGKGVSIFVKKQIPLAAGLGGDSSNAAAILKGLNEFWGLGLPIKKLLEMATQLGSDVPFFIYGGTVLMEGRGEMITALPPVKPLQLVLMMPDIPRPRNKTAKMYSGLHGSHLTDGKITAELVKTIKAGEIPRAEQLFNTFENVAFDLSGELGVYREHIRKIGAPNLHLAGSGPSMFSLVKDKAEGEELCGRLQGQGMRVEVVNTTNTSNDK